jgi:RNA polymerase sigma-70 factor (ECF subfamily)
MNDAAERASVRPESGDERAWVLAAQGGDPASFGLLVESYQRPVYSLCFLRAFRALRRYDPGRPFGTWLLSIAAHHCIDRLRSRRPLQDQGEEAELSERPDGAPGPEESLEARQRREAVAALLDSLRAPDRAALVLHYWHDLSYGEIAATLGLSLPAVKTRMHRARRALAERWIERQAAAGSVRKAHDEPSPV